MRYSSIPSAQAVVLHCEAKGIKDVVISPGSRNAPLTIGFTENPYFNCYSIVDERCAAFFALGRAQQLQRPVIVLCTSGSALLNYYPAVAEAFYSRIPLIVLSADRPFYKIDVGDGQTIRQDHVFDRHIGGSFNLRQDSCHATAKVHKYAPDYIGESDLKTHQAAIQNYNDDILNKALHMALDQRLPVHVNIPFEEPLYDTLENSTVTPKVKSIQNNSKGNWSENITLFSKKWNSSKRKLVLVGVNFPNSVEQAYLDQLANDPSVVVLTETTSNLYQSRFFPSIDSVIAPIEKSGDSDMLFKSLRPEILLTFGGLVVSKKIKAFLRKYKPQEHWHIDTHHAYDTFFALSHQFRCGVNTFFSEFLQKAMPVESHYYSRWNSHKVRYLKSRKTYLEKIPFSDFSVFNGIFNAIPNNVQLQVANSSAIRYAQLFDIRSDIEMFCNRGTSGIDGSVSTAIGASTANQKQTVLITGDLSFFYDSNALWNNYLPSNFRIILINNGGGGIFRILPGQEDTPNYETYFETAHDLDAEHICAMYRLQYSCANEENSFGKELLQFFEDPHIPKLLEINTPRLLNNKILLGYFDFISSDIINHIH